MIKFAAKGLVGLACHAAVSLSLHAAPSLPVTVPPPPALNWQPCADAPTRDCATLTVPLDYADLSKGNISLPVARARAANPANAIGPLFFNSGGPGIPSVGAVKFSDLSALFTAELVERFDIVGIDPRGTTGGINCFADEQLGRQYWDANHLYRTVSELQRILNLNGQVNQACLADNRPLVEHVDTASVVRDLEQLRRAMGVSKFSYIGFSYGTFIGNRYAKLYPDRLRASVLDAVVDRSVSDVQSFTESNIAYDQAWQQFKQWCHAAAACQLRGQNIDAILDQLLHQARLHPIAAPYNPYGDRGVNDWKLIVAIQAASVPGSVTFAWIDAIISKARNGDASLASLIYDSATGYDPGTNTYAQGGTHRAIACADTAWSQALRTAADVHVLTAAMKAVAPRFGLSNMAQGPLQCFNYPVPPVEVPPLPSIVIGGAPTLLIGATRDAMTPLLWSARVAAQMVGSRLLVRDGDGHISLGKSRCVEKAVNDALVRTKLPAFGTVCRTDADLYPPEPPPELGPVAEGAAARSGRASRPALPEAVQRLIKR